MRTRRSLLKSLLLHRWSEELCTAGASSPLCLRLSRMHRQQHLPSHRVQLSEYDESLLLDRSYVHTPQIESSDVSEDQHLPAESFGPLRTGWAVWAYLACVVCYVVFLFVDPFYWESGEQEYAVKASAHVILLALSLLLASFLRYAHRRRQRLGYLRFYRRTSMLLNVPALAAATATAVLLLATLWPHAVLPSVSPLAMLRVVAIAECVVDAVFAALYVLRVVHHNLHEAVPDAQLALEGTLCTLPGGKARRQDVVVEQQGELIRYLQRQRDNLSREVLRLQLELDRHWEQADEEAGAPRVDVEHRLAQREQELRALGAEKEALLKENRATWLLLDERDAEIHRLQANRQQHVEENSRLRGTLEEWSHRNAKLEQRLIQLQAQQDEAAASTPQSAAAAQHSMPGHNALDFSARRSFTPRVSSGGQFGAGLFGGAPLSEREPSGNAYFSPAASAEAFMYTPRSDSGTPAGQSPPQRVFSAGPMQPGPQESPFAIAAQTPL
ncbi:hypothetical protein WJX72_004435 [[Myrmecia] bisecta]|uniref:Transmembrane protein 192 n=1 Tax=[Myrmecia] bisecta TaxID=41462 RepID=A0AAW1Q8Q6_9CHLO